MKQFHRSQAIAILWLVSACTTPNPDFRECTENQPLRCEADTLTRCNGDGTAEVSQTCPLGCSTTEPRCIDLVPSNGLAGHLESSSSRADLYLGETATINTSTGEVTVAGATVSVDTHMVAQTGGPNIRVFIVRSLTAKDVLVTGANALAIVSASDIQINGAFSVSAKGAVPGPGSFNEDGCTGKLPPPSKLGGAGGGGFGSVGGLGSQGLGDHGVAGPGGNKTGTPTLIPLRGGCSGAGEAPDRTPGAGGGAVQLVSRNQIAVSGVLAVNGGGGFGGGGSGGGILLEAPIVEISGSVVANGGGGGAGISDGCTQGQDGRADAMSAPGGKCMGAPGPILILRPFGGAGAAGDVDAKSGSAGIFGIGHGGGGVGRIRVNTAPSGLRTTGIFSPNPSLGTLANP